MQLQQLAVIAAALGLFACPLNSPFGGERTSSPEAVSSVPVVAPMPPLEVRVQRVIQELGPNAQHVRFWLQLQNGKLRWPRQTALTEIGPRVRASLLRHRVPVFHLARTLHGANP